MSSLINFYRVYLNVAIAIIPLDLHTFNALFGANLSANISPATNADITKMNSIR